MRTDIKEENDQYLFAIEIPGYNKEDIEISYKDGYLTVAVEAPKDDNQGYIHRERYQRGCSRDYYVGNIDDSKITANYENGILHITVPKEGIQDNKKYISIN
jgi:HSP20 family protein